jgi:hypothetical protein
MKLSNTVSSRILPLLFKKLVACVLAYTLLSVETASVAMTPATSVGSGAAMSPSFTPQELLAQAMLYFLKPKMESALLHCRAGGLCPPDNGLKLGHVEPLPKLLCVALALA